MRIPTREDQERFEYEDKEKLKVIKKYAQRELDAITKRNIQAPHNNGRKSFLEFILKSKSFAGLPLESFQKEAIEEIYRLPFMEDRGLRSSDDKTEEMLVEQIDFYKAQLGRLGAQLAKIRVKNREDLSKKGQKGGKVPKIIQPILQATIQFIDEKPGRLEQAAKTICEAFARKYDKNNHADIKVSGVDYDVFFEKGKIYYKAFLHKETTEKSITLNTFRNTYISRAKKEIKSK